MDNRTITDQHYTLFGAIINHYANLENGLTLLLSDILGVDFPTLSILTEPYSSNDMINVINAILKRPGYKHPEHEKILQCVGVLKTHRQMRNAIAHFFWTSGSEPGAIKPMRVDIRNRRPKFIGAELEEKEYTLEELERCAIDLNDARGDLIQFLTDRDIEE